MEQYGQEHEVKEKSVYLVHLDNTRIVILTSVLIGVIALSFLIGMRLRDSGQNNNPFSENETQQSSLSDEMTPSTNEDIDKFLNEETTPTDTLLKSDDELSNSSIKTESKPEVVLKDPEVTKSEKKITVKTKPKPKKVAAKVKEKKAVVAVSAPAPKHKPTAKISSTPPAGFAIQIASFDTQEKAATESSAIRRLSYSTYIDKAMVHGKYYYRVKIGPLHSKKEAFGILNNLHATTKYMDSFVIFEK